MLLLLRLVPSGLPRNITNSVSSHTLTLSWFPPLLSQCNGVIISYLITCTSGGIIINSTRISSTSLTITGLQPFTNYTCSVRAATIVGDGPASPVHHIITDEDGEFLDHSAVTMISFMMCCTVPAGPPLQFFAIVENSITIAFIWSAPSTPNGIITEYQLQCSGGGQVFNLTVMETTTTLSGLLPYTNYSCSITARTSAGEGPTATTSVITSQDG